MQKIKLFFILSFLVIIDSFDFQLKWINNEGCDQESLIDFEMVFGKNNFLKKFFVRLSVPFGDQPLEAMLWYSLNNQTYLKLVNIKERSVCKSFNKFLGEVWYDVERALHITQVGYCPIPKGNYSLRNYQLNMKRMSFQGLPKAFIKFHIRSYDKVAKKHVLCLTGLGENV